MSVESDFDKIFSRTVQPSLSKLKILWNKYAEDWIQHLSGFYLHWCEEYNSIGTIFGNLSQEEQFAFWAWTRENKEELK